MSEYAKKKIEREAKFGELVRVHEINGCLRRAYFNRKLRVERERKLHTPQEIWGRIVENTMRGVFRREFGWFDDVYVHNHILEGHPDYVNFLKGVVVEIKYHQAGGVRTRDVEQANAYAGLLNFKKFIVRVCRLDFAKMDLVFEDYSYDFSKTTFEKQLELAKFFKYVLERDNVNLIKFYPRYPYECNNCSFKKLCGV